MAKLENPKHEHFCQQILKGETQVDAYRKAYGDKKGAVANASRLISQDRVSKRINELREKAGDRMAITIDNVLNFAMEVRERAMGLSKPDFSNALKANDQACRIIGAYQDKLEIGTKPKTIEDLVRASKAK